MGSLVQAHPEAQINSLSETAGYICKIVARTQCVYVKLMVKKVDEIISSFRAILFPKFYGEGVSEELLYAQMCGIMPKDKASLMIEYLRELKQQLDMDVEAAYNGDPAAESFDEIICCYPVIKAMINYRIAHRMLKLGIQLIPRIITEKAHSETGIDIHPAATIGHHFTIDHGTGVVIGATCIIGNNVKLYQGVTLGAKSFPLDENGNPIKGIPRHPIIEDNVIIYSNSTVLGRITIGQGTIIGGNLWVTEGTKPGEKLMQKN